MAMGRSDNSEGGPRYWFTAKTYGWGWGLPTCWQGWLVLAITIVAALGVPLLAVWLGAPVWVPVATFFAVCAGFVVTCAVKGPPLRWRWGERELDD
jgi:hypothetical protein